MACVHRARRRRCPARKGRSGCVRTHEGYAYVGHSGFADWATGDTLGANDQAAGDLVIHNNWLVGTDVYASWYTDGVRVIHTSNPSSPREVAYFVPPATTNPVKPPQRGTQTNTTQVCGVVVDEATGLIYASDMNSGLWILRRTDR